MDTCDMDLPAGTCPLFGSNRGVRAKGLWANGVDHFALNPQPQLLARAGLDFGDHDGLMVGAGTGLALSAPSFRE